VRRQEDFFVPQEKDVQETANETGLPAELSDFIFDDK
jgi:hypothetical protein